MNNKSNADAKILTTLKDNILSVTLNRPEARNALDDEMYEQLSEAFSFAAKSDDIKALLIQGTGDHFCAGNDLADFSRWPERIEAGETLSVMRLNKLVVGFKKILIASIQGSVVGIGATLLLHCDIVIASRTARLIYPFTQLGLVPEFGSTLLMPELIGQTRARQLLLLCEPLDGQQAYDLGIATVLCDEKDRAAATEQKCDAINRFPAYALRYTKRLIHSPEREELLLQKVEDEFQIFLECLQKKEHQEVIQAFFNKS